jgi:TM2 domain-containing membrane protein YozV
MSMVHCRGCGQKIHETAPACPHCGAPQRAVTASAPAIPGLTFTGPHGKSWLALFVLCFFAGFLGVHRFYVGKVGSGIAQLLTFGGLGFWILWDFIQICRGRFTDSAGNAITNSH